MYINDNKSVCLHGLMLGNWQHIKWPHWSFPTPPPHICNPASSIFFCFQSPLNLSHTDSMLYKRKPCAHHWRITRVHYFYPHWLYKTIKFFCLSYEFIIFYKMTVSSPLKKINESCFFHSCTDRFLYVYIIYMFKSLP